MAGAPGSVASLGYVRDGIENTLKLVPREKVILGVPFYTRVWTETDEGVKSSALGIEEAKAWIEANQVDLYWQKELGQYYGELPLENGDKMVWMEDEESLKLKRTWPGRMTWPVLPAGSWAWRTKRPGPPLAGIDPRP